MKFELDGGFDGVGECQKMCGIVFFAVRMSNPSLPGLIVSGDFDATALYAIIAKRRWFPNIQSSVSCPRRMHLSRKDVSKRCS